jgi:SnoaL-like domain
MNLPTTIANFMTAMQAGKAGRATLEAVFTEDAVYIEPFSGTVMRHEGRPDVIAAIAKGWESPLPDVHIRIDHVAARAADILLSWTCFSPALPGGQGLGTNRYIMREDRIALLETTLDFGDVQ